MRKNISQEEIEKIFKKRKKTWEGLITPRVDWETFKRIWNNSTSPEAAVARADLIRLRKLRK